jgi:phage terminase small subunit
MSLTPKQRAFVEYYLVSWNARDAATKVGYKSPEKTGYRLLWNPEIAALVNERLKEMGATADEVLIRLTNQARASLGDYLTVDASGKATLDWDAIKKAGDVVKKISYTRHGTPVLELYDKQRALELLGRFLKMDNVTGASQERVEDLSAIADLISKAKEDNEDAE